MACSNIDIPQLMERYLWQNRVLILFAPTPDDPAFQNQKEIITNHSDGMMERDLIIVEALYRHYVSLEGEKQPHIAAEHFYKNYDTPTESFSYILLGKDGEEKKRGTTPVSAEELFNIIDAMPMRQKEIKNKLNTNDIGKYVE